MFFSACSPMSSKARSSRLPTWSRTVAETAMPPGCGDALEPRRHVDAVAEDVVALDDDVAEIDADAEFDAAVLRHVGVALAHPALDFGGAGDRVHDARELHQHAVAGQLDDAPLMLGDLGVDQLARDAP